MTARDGQHRPFEVEAEFEPTMRIETPKLAWLHRAKACAAATLFAVTAVLPVTATAEAMQAGAGTLWETVDALANQVPFSKRNVEKTLSLPLRERVVPSNPLFDFFEGAGLRLRGGEVVANVDLRVKKDDPRIGLLVLNLEGACVRIDDVRARYRALELTDFPRGHSLEESTSFSSAQRWGNSPLASKNGILIASPTWCLMLQGPRSGSGLDVADRPQPDARGARQNSANINP